MTDKLVDISISDLQSLRDLYKIDWPKYNVGYGTLDTYLRWLKQDPIVPDLRVFSLNGDWSDGTFVITDWNMLFFNTMNTDFNRIERALSLIDFSKRYTIASVEQRLIDMTKNFVKKRQLLFVLSETKWYRLPKEEGSKIEIEKPDEIILKPLSEKDVEIANNLWPFKHPGSLKFLRRLAKYNINYGAYTKDGELVAWCFRLPAGGLGTLQVAESHKRKGYGSLMVRVMSKAISDTGYDVFAPIVVENYPSLRMFEKLGFKQVDRMTWLPPEQYGDWSEE